MYSRVASAAVCGLEILPITVETDVSDGLPQFIMVGYLSAQVREAEDRIRSAFRNSGILLPSKRITVNMSPASIPKSGSLYDLPSALSLLASTGQVPPEALCGIMAVGELGLSGDVNAVSGVLPIAASAAEAGMRTLIVPMGNLGEGLAINTVHVVGVSKLNDAVAYLRHGTVPAGEDGIVPPSVRSRSAAEDFRDIHGQELGKRAAEISAAGFHNLLLAGPPGSGKTMLARRMPSILPAMTEEECLEVSKIYSIAGLIDPMSPLVTERPFRHPHHTISPQALSGGGRIPRPGEITLAHRGILFLDELPEFHRRSMEVLRQPLEDHEIIISRTAGSFRFPANFLLLAAMNRCPCGMYPVFEKCTCSPRETASYMNRISRPLLDRIDLCVQCPPVTFRELSGQGPPEESSAAIRERTERAHRIEAERFHDTPFRFNSDIPSGSIREFCETDAEAEQRLAQVYELFGLSARGCHRTLKVARTIADLEGSPKILRRHIDEALAYRLPASPRPGAAQMKIRP